jgi:hypothetical protein
MIESLNEEQNARIEALKASREVLAEHSGGPFSSHVRSVSTVDLIAVAGWIIDGKDPWKPQTVQVEPTYSFIGKETTIDPEIQNFVKNQTEYTKDTDPANGQCWKCGSVLSASEKCINLDCVESEPI